MLGTEFVRDNAAAIRFAWKNILPAAAKLIDGASTTNLSGEMMARLLTGQHQSSGTGLHVAFSGDQIASSIMSHDPTLQDELLDWTPAHI